MKQKINLNKTVFNKRTYEKTIDTSFKELGVKSIQEQIDEQPTVQEFFDMYNVLFYEIPDLGATNSHEYLVKTSGELLGDEVNDELIILLEYDYLVAVIQASWNWPIARKDMEIYGLKGAIYADNRHDLRIRISEGYDEFSESRMKLEEMPIPYNDPFLLLTALVRDEIKLKNYDLNSLENNMIVVEILEAARTSAKEKKTVFLD